MAYHLGNGIWNTVFAVPSVVVDEHLKMASGLSVKVLLLLLRRGGGMEPGEVAVILGQSTADIQDALNYWVQAGIIHRSTENAPDKPALANPPVQQLTPVLQYQQLSESKEELQPSSAPLEPATEDTRKIATLSSKRRRLTTQEINELAEQDETIEYLLQETQSVLGKPLTPVSTDIVVAMYSYYGMKPDLILMLIHYCVSLGKDSMRYIEKVAADWLDKGIDTHEKAESEILRLTKKNTAEGKIKAAFGIHDRGLISSEKKCIQTWTEQYGLDIALITLAYERTIELKGKLSFPYINGILTNWYQSDIATPAQALQEMRDNRAKQQELAGEGVRSSYDIGELEKMINYGEIV